MSAFPQTMAAAFASVQEALDNCKKSGNTEWLERWRLRFATERQGPQLSPSDTDALSDRIATLLTEHGDGLAD